LAEAAGVCKGPVQIDGSRALANAGSAGKVLVCDAEAGADGTWMHNPEASEDGIRAGTAEV
jgi:hypothetical protein